MNGPDRQQVDTDYVRLFARVGVNQWKLILVVAGVIWAGTGLALLVIPTTYEASATIFIDDSRANVPNFLRDFIGSGDADLHLAILRSRALASDVVKSLPRESVDDLLSASALQNLLAHAHNALDWLLGRQAAVASPEEQATAELQNKRVQFSSKPRGEIEIRATAYQPRVAMNLVNTYVEVLQSKTRSYTRDEARAIREFLEMYMGQIRGTLQEAEQKLKLTQGRGVARFPGQAASQLTALDGELADVQASKEIAQARLSFLKGGKGPAEAFGATPSQIAIDQLRQRLGILEGKLVRLREKYTDEHPLVRATLSEIKDVRANVAQTIQSSQKPRPSVTVRLGTAERAALAKQMADLAVEVSSLDAKEAVLKQRAAIVGRTASTLSAADVEASRLARAVETQRNLLSGLSDKLTAVRVQEQSDGRTLRVIDLASLPQQPSNSAAGRWMLFGLLGGLGLGIGLAACVESFNDPVETEEEVARLVRLPILGWLPTERGTVSQREPRSEPLNFFTAAAPQSLAAEGCRTIRTNLESAARHHAMRTVMVASAGPREGKSTVVLNLTLVFHEMGRRVAVVDADLRRPSLQRAAGSPAEKGLVDVLSGNLPWPEAVQKIEEGLLFLPAGVVKPTQQGSVLSRERVERLLDSAKAHADLVLLDSAPVLAVADNLVLASLVDGVVLVVRAGHTQRQDLLAAKEQLDKMGAHLLGVVINRVSTSRRRRHYARYGSYYAPAAPALHGWRGWKLGQLLTAYATRADRRQRGSARSHQS